MKYFMLLLALKGVLASDEHLGFKLHEKAAQNFKLEMMTLKGRGPWKIPTSALVFAKEDRHVYRFKDSYLKSIDVTLLGRDGQSFTIQSEELKDGDQIVVQGSGFLSIVDEATFGQELSHDH